MESGDRAAGYGDKTERKHFSGQDEAGAIGELGQRGHFEGRQGKENAEGQGEDGSELDVGAEVIARGKQEPDGDHAGGEAVNDEAPGKGQRVKFEHVGQARAVLHVTSAPNGKEQQRMTLPTRPNRK